MIKDSYAIISDIHGNKWALKAVLESIYSKNVKAIINLGDTFYGPLDPAGTAEILEKTEMVSVCGNEDRIIYQSESAASENHTLNYVRDQLSAKSINWLKNIPPSDVSFNLFYLCHGTSNSDHEYFVEDVRQGYAQIKPETILLTQSESIDQKIILCGHSHLPQCVHTSEGGMIVNPGSVGLQAYTDDLPVFHNMETGSPMACYALLRKTELSWLVEFIRVDYDWQNAARLALKNKRQDWSHWLMTGRAT